MKNREAVVATGALALVWGYTWIVLKVATADASLFALIAIRMVLGALALFAVAALMREPLKSPPPRQTALIGFCQVTLMMTFQVLALTTGGAGKTALLVYTFPFWIALLSLRLLDERMTRTGVVTIVVAAVGLGFVLYPLDFGHELLSKLFALLSAVSWAFGSIFTKRLRAKHHVELLPFTAWQMAYGAIPTVILALLLPGGYVHFTPAFDVALAYIVIFGTATAFWLWFYIMERLSAVGAGIASLLTPVVSVLAAWIQLHERPGAAELFGMLLILVALAFNGIPPEVWTKRFGRGVPADCATGPR